jgi:hypothetical protein
MFSSGVLHGKRLYIQTDDANSTRGHGEGIVGLWDGGSCNRNLKCGRDVMAANL